MIPCILRAIKITDSYDMMIIVNSFKGPMIPCILRAIKMKDPYDMMIIVLVLRDQ